MSALFLRVFWVSLTTSAVLLPVLLLAKPMSRRYRPKSCYLLWLLFCLRLLIPVEIPLPRPAVTLEVPRTVQEFPDAVLVLPDMAAPQVTAPAAPAADPLAVAALIWAAGVLLALLIQTALFLRAKGRLLLASEEDPAGPREGIPVRRADVSSPMTVGLLRPVIFLPRDLEQVDVPMALRHELCHLRRRDLWYKALFFLCACLHWFNPLAWKLGRVAGEQLELCCDRDVVAGQDETFRREYGSLLLRSAAAGQPFPLTTHLGGSDLKGRITNLFTIKKRGGILVCLLACAALLMGSLVGCQTAGAQSAPALQEPPAVNETPAPPEVPNAPLPMPADWVWPVEGETVLSALHGTRRHPVTGAVTSHRGVDIPAPAGAEVLAPIGGRVVFAGFDAEKGNWILLDHGGGLNTLYAHLLEIHAEPGGAVSAGQTIGLVGQTGAATGAHLHFEVLESSNSLDPLSFYTHMPFTHTAGVNFTVDQP